jgi:hypothetical protein
LVFCWLRRSFYCKAASTLNASPRRWQTDVRFTPESGPVRRKPSCLLWVRSRHLQRNRAYPLYPNSDRESAFPLQFSTVTSAWSQKRKQKHRCHSTAISCVKNLSGRVASAAVSLFGGCQGVDSRLRFWAMTPFGAVLVLSGKTYAQDGPANPLMQRCAPHDLNLRPLPFEGRESLTVQPYQYLACSFRN